MGSEPDTALVTKRLQDLLDILTLPITLAALDAKLADYVFFPLSNVLRHLEKLPLRARERTFEAISILLRTAWKQTINPQLGLQLLILLSFVLDRNPRGKKPPETSEELRTVALSCVGQIFATLGNKEAGREAPRRNSQWPAY